MPTTLYEIVELPNGDYALCRVDDSDKPLVRISFSDEARDLMDDRDVSVAKAMIAAGIEAVSNLAHDVSFDDDEDFELSTATGAHTLH
ncbi:MAG: hypothetical protein LAT63_00495 [Marinobacter sp.]|nr:hypothetical protein [Marinobacter sp.]